MDSYQSIGLDCSEGFTTQPNFWNRNNLNNYGGNCYSPIRPEKARRTELERIQQCQTLCLRQTHPTNGSTTNPTYDSRGSVVVFQER